MNFKNKKIIFIGWSISGKAVVPFLKKQYSRITVLEKNKSSKLKKKKNSLDSSLKIKRGSYKLVDFHNVQLVILSPGVPFNSIIIKKIKEKGIPIIGEAELSSTFINKKIVAISGTNGKTTTTKLLHEMMIYNLKKTFLCGNIGIPITKSVYNIDLIDIVIIEISSFQLDTAKKLKPTTSILINIAEDHMDRYKNLDEYIDAKLKIFKNQSKYNIGLINISDKTTKNILNIKKLYQYISKSKKKVCANIKNKTISIKYNMQKIISIDLTKSKLKEFHNKQNITSAFFAAIIEGYNFSKIQLGINKFEKIDHRIQTIAYINGVRYINDSKSTNIHSTINALKNIKTSSILILGGKSKKANFKLIMTVIFKKKIKFIISMGKSNKKIKNILNYYTDKKLILSINMENAIKKAYKLAKKGDSILLSPGCSSFDEFKNYKERGKRFKKIIKKLIFF